MSNYEQIVEAFLQRRDPADRKVKAMFNRNKLSEYNGGWRGETSGAWGTSAGTLRLSYTRDLGGSTLYSYEHHILAMFRGDVLILNADGAPSPTTRTQQKALHDAAEPRRYTEEGWVPDLEKRKALGFRVAYLPFSALREASISAQDVKIKVLDVTPGFHVKRKRIESWRPTQYRPTCELCKLSTFHKHEVEREEHYLGEVLFETYQGRYVSGLDRNDNPARRKFYLALLPKKAKPRTVAAALEALRPASVPAGTPRQGEWFFVPAPDLTVKPAAARKQVPIASSKGAEQALQLDEMLIREQLKRHSDWEADAIRERTRYGRHVAERMHCNGAVYVRGTVRDTEHDPLVLEGWHKVVRNRAAGSWSVSKDGPKVD